MFNIRIRILLYEEDLLTKAAMESFFSSETLTTVQIKTEFKTTTTSKIPIVQLQRFIRNNQTLRFI